MNDIKTETISNLEKLINKIKDNFYTEKELINIYKNLKNIDLLSYPDPLTIKYLVRGFWLSMYLENMEDIE